MLHLEVKRLVHRDTYTGIEIGGILQRGFLHFQAPRQNGLGLAKKAPSVKKRSKALQATHSLPGRLAFPIHQPRNTIRDSISALFRGDGHKFGNLSLHLWALTLRTGDFFLLIF